MSREANENPSERRGNEHLRQAERGDTSSQSRTDDPNPGHTPSKAEGDEKDVDEALARE